MKRNHNTQKASFLVNKKLAIIVSLIIFCPIIFSSAIYYWETTPQNYVDHSQYRYQQYIPIEGQKVVVICFDDGWQNQYDNALPILNQFGFKATFGIITGYVDDNLPMYMSWREIVELALDGQDIASHTYNHKNLNFVDAATITFELNKSVQDLDAYGIKAPVFIYPQGGGAGNATVESLVQQYFLVGRSTREATVKMDRTFDAFNIPAYPILNSTTFSDFSNMVNQAGNSTVPILFYHKISDEDVSTATTQQMFAAEMQYLHDNGFTVMTMRDLFTVAMEPT